ncbi:MAG TPA: response regulator [Vicinamibacterales bacterium]|nr:response regulator [Vicinamibacterales bacterium]
MHVLVCDDDSGTRFVIHRLLVQKLGCTVSECGDGVEALTRLAVGDIDLLILDITMPTLDGIDVLTAIRESPPMAHLPVIMLSGERREEVIRKLIELGILGYVIKPPRAEPLIALVARARRTLEARNPPAGRVSGGEIRLDQDTPALLVDGNAQYRSFFAAHVEPYGRTTLAHSGLDALAFFKRTPTRIVFIGDELGVVGAELLIRKLHEMRADQPLRIIGVRDADASQKPVTGIDDAMERTLVPATHLAELRRFVRVMGPLETASPIVGDLSDALTSASGQVFGMMLDSAIVPAAEAIGDFELCATVDIAVQQRFVVGVDLHLALRDARVIVARMRSSEPETVSDADITASVSELVTLLAGRLRAGLDGRGIESTCSAPQVSRHDPAPAEAPPEGHGVHLQLTASGAGASWALHARVSEVGSTLTEVSADAA